MKEFKGLLKSEIKKIEKLANKVNKVNDCKVTGYSYTITHPFDFDPESTFIECNSEIMRGYEEPVEYSINLTIPLFDRRKSYAWTIIDGKYVK